MAHLKKLKTLKYNKIIEKQIRSVAAILLILLSSLIGYFTASSEQVAVAKPFAISLASNQAEVAIFSTIYQALQEAKVSIYIAIYSLTDDRIITLLRDKADNGIEVIVVHDAVATQNIASRLGTNSTSIPYQHRGLMHNKLIVIDHHTVWMGSCNFTSESFTRQANLMAGIISPEIARTVEEKIIQMKNRSLQKLLPLIQTTDMQTIEFRLLPDTRDSEGKVVELIRAAKSTIRVAMFTFTNRRLADALIHAKNRGVDVQVVIDRDSSKGPSQSIFKRLQAEGVTCLRSDRIGLLHHKFAWIDNSTLVFGSANWTKAAFHANDEHIVIITPLLQEQIEFMQQLWKKTMKETLSHIKTAEHSTLCA